MLEIKEKKMKEKIERSQQPLRGSTARDFCTLIEKGKQEKREKDIFQSARPSV